MGPGGAPRRVLELHRGRDEMFEIRPLKGESFTVNRGHILTLVRTNEGKLSELRNRDGELIDISVDDWLGASDYFRHLHKLLRMPINFAERPAPTIDPYILGVLLGDGSLVRSVSVTTPDIEIVDAINRFAEENGLRVRREQLANNAANSYFLVDDRSQRNALTDKLRDLRVQAEGVTNKRGRRIDKGFIYKVINNRVYIGEAVHKGTAYPGEHTAIISKELWDGLHTMLQRSPRERRAENRSTSEALLKGLIFSNSGSAMTPTYTRKGDRLYHYYVSMDVIQNRMTAPGAGPTRLPAAMVDGVVIAEMRRMIATPELAARVVQTFKGEGTCIDEREIVGALTRFDELWASLFPAEQARITRLLVSRVTVGSAGIAVDLRHHGVGSLVRDLTASKSQEAAA